MSLLDVMAAEISSNMNCDSYTGILNIVAHASRKLFHVFTTL